AASLPLEELEVVPKPESIGAIGAGPAGLSFAYQMARRGYPVTVYDEHDEAGGMLRHGIPDYRLPPQILDREIQRILDLGVALELNTRVGRDVTIDRHRR
ncbi:MAG: NAD(P)-binding protein, partial [Gemmatimonadales bacterium]